MGKKGDPNERSEGDWHFDLAKVFAQRLPGLYSFFVKPRPGEPVVYSAVSLRYWRGGFLAVARGEWIDGSGACVCFGAGPTIFTAMRNLSAAITKGEWKRDKFADALAQQQLELRRIRDNPEMD